VLFRRARIRSILRACAAAGGRLLASLLFEVSAFDLWIYAAALGAMILASAGAMLPPALRVSRVDPVIALREE